MVAREIEYIYIYIWIQGEAWEGGWDIEPVGVHTN
jgi:hypothetical protein